MMRSNWQWFADKAGWKLGKTIGFSRERPAAQQIAEQIIADGHAEGFLKSARRGRPKRGGLRADLVAAVESMVRIKRRKPRLRPAKPMPLFQNT